MINWTQITLRAVQCISILVLGGACLLSSFSGDHVGSLILSALTALCVSYRIRNYKLLAKSGFCFMTVALFVQCCTRHDSLFIWCVGVALVLASVCVVAERLKAWSSIRGICILLGGIWCLSQSVTVQQIRHAFGERKAVCLNRGSWGNVYDNGKGLTIKGQYSYNLFASLIGAKHITTLEGLKGNSELWIVTPTQPFTEEEKAQILGWVRDGGFLYIVSDHTNLFGHADVLNDLLEPVHTQVQANCILDATGDGGTYFSCFDTFKGLTANSFKGCGTPWLVQNGYSERTDYGRTSFFSDNQISDEENSSVYIIGTTVPYGFGAVVLFGDSTLFANFALSRPSAQALLERMMNLGKPLPWFPLSAALFCMLAPVARNDIKALSGKRVLPCLLACASGIIAIASVLPCLPCKDFRLNFPDNTLKVKGDWDLVEENNPSYFTLFASCYNQACGLPQWCGRTRDTGIIVFSNGKTLTADDMGAAKSFNAPSAEELLQKEPSISSEAFVKKLVSDSKFSSFWFEEGIGPFKELAYTQFWQRLSDQKNEEAIPSLGSTYSASGTFTVQGSQPVHVEAKITPVEGLAPWVVLGDWIVAQEVQKGVFLIMGPWQHPSWGRANAVLRLSEGPPP